MQAFINYLMEHLYINTNYSLIVKFSFNKNREVYMSGKQIGVVILNSHNIDFYQNIYKIILYRLELVMENYDKNIYPDTIIISYKALTHQDSLDYPKLATLNLENKSMFIKTNLSKVFSSKYLPLTINESYYGHRVDGDLKVTYLNKLKKNILNMGLEIPELLNKSELFNKLNVFISKVKFKNNILTKIIINCSLNDYINSNENGFIRMVFDLNTSIPLYEVRDLIIDKDVFLRKINNYSVMVNNNKLLELSRSVKLDSIKLPKFYYSSISNPNIGVLDVETFVNSAGLGQVYCIGYSTLSNRDSIESFYLSDLSPSLNSNLLIINCIDSMLNSKYNNYYWYIHNMGKFDMVYIYKTLEDFNLNFKSQYYKLSTIYKDGKMLRLVVKRKVKNKYIKMTFLDSLNILPGSLNTLTKDFKVKYLKGYFPYSFVNENNLTYIGETPKINYFNSITVSDYNKIYSKDNWSLKEETIRYIKNDILGLLEILEKFKKYLHIEHNLEMTEGLTISRLALNKYLKYYLKDFKIPLINKLNIFDYIYKGYYGGRTEVFKPYGKQLYYYDVNSLYPKVSLNDMPGMKVCYKKSFTPDGLDLNNLFGVFRAVVKTNNDYLGLLPVKTKLGLIFPNGEFEGFWSSEELNFAKEIGYQVRVIEGYNFDKVPSYFKDYVLDLYKLKANTSGSEKITNKSLLNNLLGRFGLNIIKPISQVVNNKQLDKILSTREVKSIQEINNNTHLINYNPLVDIDICMEHGVDYIKTLLNNNNLNIENNIDVFQDVSIIVAVMITSYARVFMLKLMSKVINEGGSIYYTDTDSLVTDIPLENINPDLVGSGLGQFKLEYVIKEAYFISNKTYCLVLLDNTTIIKCKGVNKNSITVEDFKSMYYSHKNIFASKTTSKSDLSKGSVIIMDKDILLDHDVYKKREKIYNQNGIWCHTKPLLYNNIIKDLVIKK